MSKRLDENLGSVGYDGLIVANEPVADVFTVASGYTLKATDEEELRKAGILLSDAIEY